MIPSPLRLVVRTEEGKEYPKHLNAPTLDTLQDALTDLYAHIECDSKATSVKAEMPYEDQGENHTFTVIGDVEQSPDNMAAEMWEEIQGFRY